MTEFHDDDTNGRAHHTRAMTSRPRTAAPIAVVVGIVALFAALAGSSGLSTSGQAPAVDVAATTRPVYRSGNAPASARSPRSPVIQFEANVGQSPDDARYVAHGPGFTADVLADGVRVSQTRRAASGGRPAASEGDLVASARLRFVGADASGAFDAREPGTALSNYLVGSDSSRWLRHVPGFRQLRQPLIYPGIDLVYYGRDGEFEYDLVLQPKADASRIRIAVDGEHKPSIDTNGDLLLDGPGGALRMHRPVLYQHIDGAKKTLAGDYVLLASNEVGFRLPAYDHDRPLVIDPTFKLLYATYLGGVHDDQVGGMALDTQGNAYVVGNSGSEDWPVSGNAYQGKRKNIGSYVRNVVVTKFDASGDLVYSTFLGGSTNDYGLGIALDASGNAYVTGNTTSSDFPVTANAIQSTLQGSSSAFLSVLSPDGSALSYSTLFGGNSGGRSVAFDAAGTLWLGGYAGPGLTTTSNAYKKTLATGTGAFIAKFSLPPAGPAQLLASTYYGTDAPQPNNLASGVFLQSMALDPAGTPWFAAQAYTTNLPQTSNALTTAPTALDAGCRIGVAALNSFGFVGHFSADLSTLAYASYLTGKTRVPGDCAEYAYSLAFDPAGNVYVGGVTASDVFPTTAGAAQPGYPGNSGYYGFVGFVTKLKADGSAILWSSYLGGSTGDSFLSNVVADNAGSPWAFIATGGGSNYPVTSDAFQPAHGGGSYDASLVHLDAATGALVYATYFGGSGDDGTSALALDASNNVYMAGATNSGNLPVTATAFQPTLTANAYDGSDWFFGILGTGTISRLSTTRAGNAGDVTLTLDGAGFVDGSTCALVAASTSIASGSAVLASGGTQIACHFSLAGAAPGVYDVTVTLPDGTVLRKASAFTVTAGGQPQVFADVVGRSKIRTGVPSRFTVSVGNTGSVDAWFTVVHVVVNSDLTYALPNGLRPLNAASGVDYQTRSTTADVDLGLRYFSYVVPLIPAGKTLSMPLDLTSLGPQTWVVSASTDLPWFDSRADADTALRAAAAGALPVPGCAPVPGKPYLSNCFGHWLDAIATNGAGVTSTLTDSGGSLVRANPWDRTMFGKQFSQGLLDALSASTGASVTPTVALPTTTVAGTPVVGLQASGLYLTDVAFSSSQPVMGASRVHLEGGKTDRTLQFGGCFPGVELNPSPWVETYRGSCIGGLRTIDEQRDYTGHDLLFQGCSGVEMRRRTESCDDTPIPPACKWTSYAHQTKAGLAKTLDSGTDCGSSGGSIDPNDKSGLVGDGSTGHFVRGSVPLSYQIAFENQATASLPAANVVVSDQLDPTQVDLATLTLGSVSFGGITVSVPPGLSSYSTIQPIDATMSVRIQGSLDTTTGMLKWTFSTLDPATHLPPSDPSIGFLPPDTDGMKGQAAVIFNVASKRGLAEGASISNTASIVFDTNAAIATPTWVNRLDNIAPVSHVVALAQQGSSASFDVTWSGTDAGSGVSTYKVFVSDNGGAFSVWQSNVATTTATYAGTTGHVYGFYAVATDGAGNVEAAKTAAEQSITAGAAASTTDGSGGGGGCTIGGDGRGDPTLPVSVILAAGVLGLLRRRASTRRRAAG